MPPTVTSPPVRHCNRVEPERADRDQSGQTQPTGIRNTRARPRGNDRSNQTHALRNDNSVRRQFNLRGCLAPVPRYSDAMNKVTKLLHTRYRVNDLERTVKFYKEILGLEELRRIKSPRGSELVFLKAPQSDELIEITYYPGSGPVQ